MLEKFIGLYPVSKTLRFELRPQGETMKTLEREGFVGIDRQLAQNYSKAKKILDLYYKHVIEDVLSRTTIELDKLNEYRDLYNDPKISFNSDKKFLKLRDDMRKSIIKNFEKEPYYKDLFKKGVISNLAREYILNNEDIKEKEEYIGILDSFDNFSSYFTGFFENRKNIFSKEAISTSLAYRIVDENLPNYLDNMKAFEKIVLKINKDVESVKENLNNEVVKINNINEFFTVEGFNKVLSQKGIDKYQTIIGGYTEEDGVKIQGINEKVNLYNQTKDRFDRIPRLKSLKKQILSDRMSASFKLDMIEDDEDLLKVIGSFHEHMMSSEIIDRMKEIETYINDCQGEGIFVGYDVLSDLSQYSTNNWSLVRDYLTYKYDEEFGKNKKITDTYIAKRIKIIENKSDYDIKELDSGLREYIKSKTIFLEGEYNPIYNYFLENINNNIVIIKELSSKIDDILNNRSMNIRDNDDTITNIKKYLDSYLELQRTIKPILDTITVQGKDEVFYELLFDVGNLISGTVSIYNKVRNYITKKPYREDKIKLNIECASLLAGWDKNKEMDNLGIILLKDGRYYLGIMRKKYNKIFKEVTLTDNVENSYQKMVYKLLPGPNKMLPKVLIKSKKGLETFNPSEEILDIYDRGSFKKGDNFSLEDCHTLIDYYKDCLNKHEDWSKFGFQFRDTKDYEDISQFYKEVSDQGYMITYENIPEQYIDSLVEEGKLLLFEIYCKDFSPKSKGKPNLHTLYWKAVFDPKNLEDVVYKLNGEAEIFFREKSIPLKITHPANEPIDRKNPTLADSGQSLFPYDLIKDKRYAYDKFLFHVPITINFKADGRQQVNLLARKSIKENDKPYIIGIDRGERHLLYVVVIDGDGRIVEQRSLNTITYSDGKNNISVDYNELLARKEKDNLQNKRNWKTSNTIKEIKSGYLSLAIKEISNLIEKYNAIVVLENLNMGFKSSRTKVEKQVYQKFEKMLIDKLNLYVNKDKEIDAYGGVLKPYQLTSQFDSFKNMGRQSGILFYVPAWNTSKIDPKTGFVNLFRTRYENSEKTKDFINKFDDIFWENSKDGSLELNFKFKYSSFRNSGYGIDKEWIANTYGTRTFNQRKEKSRAWESQTVDLSRKMIELFKEYEIPTDEGSVKDRLLEVNKGFYKEFMYICGLMFSLRNSETNSYNDHIISPIVDENGEHFDSSKADSSLPQDADANGAYNIARKGLMLVERIKGTAYDDLKTLKLDITNQDWLEYVQSKNLKNRI